jgi:hypothetical protein
MATVPADAPTYFVPAAFGAALIAGTVRNARQQPLDGIAVSLPQLAATTQTELDIEF